MMVTPLSFGESLSQHVSQVVPGSFVCPLCGSRDVETHSNDEDKMLSASDMGSSRREVSHGKILRCRACRFGFRALRPAEEELFTLYRQLDPEVYEKESRGRIKTAKRHLRIVQRYVAGGRVLDVGCASGAFLDCAADAGWSVVGVEPAEFLCHKAKQLLHGRGEVFCVPLQQADLPASSFDVVTLWDVLEHVPDPLRFMQHCAKLLKPAGYLFANVPDLDSVQARILGERWPLLLAEHLNYFNRQSLSLCGNLAQLRLVAFGRRPASFSLEYIFYRLTQHRVPGASFVHNTLRGSFLSATCAPVFLGETYSVWICPPDNPTGGGELREG
jgi:SAM-dependent methyltransferase